MQEKLHLKQHPGIDPPNFTTKISDVGDGIVYLEDTYCYPRGGGQPGDRGTISKNGNISKCSNFSMFLDVFSDHRHRIAILFAFIQASQRAALKYPHDYIPTKKFSLFWEPRQILMWPAGIEDDMVET